MAPPTPLHQAATFYEGKWNESVDRCFVGALVEETMNGHFRVGQHNYGAIRNAMYEVNRVFRTDFDVRFCYARFRKLRHRFELFRWIIRLSGVTHDPITNHVQCSADGWEFICEKEPLARAYMLHGEKQWDALRILFEEGPYSPEVIVDTPEVIELSSDHDDEARVAAHKKGKAKEGSGGKQKDVDMIGKEGEPDNDWWAEVAMGDPHFLSDSEVSQPSEFSSTEAKRKREPVDVAKKIGRRLWGNDDSSCASFSPHKK